jgi:NADH-quinone oxidoreductase subunit G
MSAEAKTEQREDLVTIEVDGREMQAPKGEMLIRVTDAAGISIPRFCYHDKLSVAANCRMCLVDVEKAPKPLPACATPVADGMKVYTRSKRAVDAQQGVMEFLLINHPLDCPVCDQGGECELQDLSMGFGRAVSRFTERKRVVPDPNIGPLVSTDMTRCIHCTRCVRFLEEIAGTRELGAVGRGEHMKITTWVERSVDSELSGNIIDLCPVGALNNKPFRFRARAWEMKARPSVSSHDAVGSNLFLHTLRGRVMRVVPRDAEAINECWIADRDRYSNEGLYAPERLEVPMVKRDGQWRETDWEEAIGAAVTGLREAARGDAASNLGALASPRASVEELYLIQGLLRGLGSNNIDCRLRQTDFSDQAAFGRQPRMGLSIPDLQRQDAVLLVGSNIRHDQPMLGHRLRQAWRERDARISLVNPVDWPLHFEPLVNRVVTPSAMVDALAAVAKAAADKLGRDLPAALKDLVGAADADDQATRIADSLSEAEAATVLVGNFAMTHPRASTLRALAAFIGEAVGASISLMPESANTAGAWAAGAVPHRLPGGGSAEGDGPDAAAMLESPPGAMLLWDFDPVHDTAAGADHRLADAKFTVAATSFATESLRAVADVLLPVAALPEQDASLLSAENRWQVAPPATRPPGEARPGWRVLRVLGHELGVESFDFLELNAVRESLKSELGEAGDESIYQIPATLAEGRGIDGDLERIGDVPIYAHDLLTRHSAPLQETTLAEDGWLALNPADADRLGLAADQRAVASRNGKSAEFTVRVSGQVPAGAVWLPVATPASASLGSGTGAVQVSGAGEDMA